VDVAEGAILVQFPELSEEEANRAAVTAARQLSARRPPGFLDAIPGARTLLVEFEPDGSARGRLAKAVQDAKGSDAEPSGRRVLRLPVFYDPDPAVGPDLPELARAAGISESEFAGRHCAGEYRVAFLGFAPGFAYLSGLAPGLHAPRLSTPRTRVPAGAVGIASGYTGIYPGGTPGGWRLIGLSPVALFDARRDPPTLLLPGDGVRFDAIGREEYEKRRSTLDPDPTPAPAPGSPLFRVAAPGVLTSVQGAPRRGWGIYGVPSGGAMDVESLAAGNADLGNAPLAPALEMTLVGPELELLSETEIAFSPGADEAALNGRPIAAGQIVRAAAGDRLKIGPLHGTARSYLCVRGGLSRSERPEPPRRLAAGDVVAGSTRREPASLAARAAVGAPEAELILRVLPGPQRDLFDPDGLATFFESPYRVSASSDRRGIRLEGPPISARESPDIPPEATTLGGIQVPRDGQPIVLGPDRPVTGGYARIAAVIAADFPRLARALPGAAVRFREVTLEQALGAPGKA
jgi:KipI family sensor histidine kinase inhibitor